MTSVSTGHVVLTPTQQVGSGWPKRGSNPEPPHQESRALPNELPPPSLLLMRETNVQKELIRIGDGNNKKATSQ